MANRPFAEWLSEYAKSHTHPVNRFCHTIGIPLVALSAPVGVLAPLWSPAWPLFFALFGVGWTFQFVGLRWWLAKVRGRAP